MGLFGTPEPTKSCPSGQLIRKLLFWVLGRVLRSFWVWLIQIFINLATKAVLVVKLHFYHQMGPHRPQNNEWPNQEAQWKMSIIGLLVELIRQSRPKMTNLELSKNFVDTYFLSKKWHQRLFTVIKVNICV